MTSSKPDGGHPPVTTYTLAEITSVLRETMPTLGDEAKMALIVEKLRAIR